MGIAVMYGAGNIGRGFIGQVFYLSGFETRFIDINMTLIDRFNTDKAYPVYVTAGNRYEKEEVRNVAGIDGKNIGAVAEAIADAEIMATAIGVNVLKFIAVPIARGISLRYARNRSPLNIIICENMIGADEYLRSLVFANLSDEEKEWASDNIGFTEASIGRMVPAVPEEIGKENPLAVCVEPFRKLPIDSDALKGELPALVGVEPFSPFGFYISRKLYVHNMSHAVTAYLGSLCGDEYIYEATGRPEIKLIASLAIEESALALSLEYGVPIRELLAHGSDLLYRFENRLLGDPVSRVGRDTVRKLSPSDRLAGAIKLAQKHSIVPAAIMLGAAAALLFEGENDAASEKVSSFARENGVRAALSEFSQITDDSTVEIISDFYERLKNGEKLMSLVTSLELLKRN